MNVVTAEEMRAIENEAVGAGTSLSSLMQLAGLAVSRAAQREARAEHVLVLVGPGNNGGDGLIAASNLLSLGNSVTAYTFHRKDLLGYDGPAVRSESDGGQEQLRGLLGRSSVVVDALLGIGQTRPPSEELAAILREVNGNRRRGSLGLAVDIPTGVETDTGAVPGEAFRADITLCMGFLKVGAVLYPGAAYAGTVQVADVGIPLQLGRAIPTTVPSAEEIKDTLPKRRADSNKGTSGRLLVVAGSRDFLGAPGLVSMAAYRTGAGLVEVASLPVVQQAVAAHALEPVFTLLPENEGRISPDAADSIGRALRRVRGVVVGPGMGLSDGTIRLTHEILQLLARQKVPAVVDADGLNALSRLDGWPDIGAPVVLTPHPGEMSRLTGLSIDRIQSDRLSIAREHAERWGTVVVLKGAGTVVAAPDGRAAINPTGGPNLATAGSGDVLSGIIGGLLAQGSDLFAAALAGVYLHGRAGDILRAEQGDVGTVASDLIDTLPRARLSILQEGGSQNERP